jgi:hypothetical protein
VNCRQAATLNEATVFSSQEVKGAKPGNKGGLGPPMAGPTANQVAQAEHGPPPPVAYVVPLTSRYSAHIPFSTAAFFLMERYGHPFLTRYWLKTARNSNGTQGPLSAAARMRR